MVQGFVPDFTEGAILVGGWQAGQPKKSVWTTTKAKQRKGFDYRSLPMAEVWIP